MKKIKIFSDKNSARKTEREKAQAMVVSFIYVSIVALIAVYMMTYANNLHNVVIREVKHSMSFYAGEAALIRAYVALHTGAAYPVGTINVAPMTVTTNPVVNLGNGVRRFSVNVNW